ncbi:MAG: hypothetical protein JWM76_4753 [Pseudonocardiales bacterium]|nr:hypothetical protein [Pseudonocardiales bacterium]
MDLDAAQPSAEQSVDANKALVDRMVRSFYWFMLGRRRSVTGFAILAAVGLLAAVLFGWPFLIIAVVLPLLLARRVHRSINRQFASLREPGATIRTKFDDTSMILATPLTQRTIDFAQIASVEQRDGVVILADRDDGAYIVVPDEVISASTLQRIRACIRPS